MNLLDKLKKQGKQKFWINLEVQGVIDKGGRHWKHTVKYNVINHRLDTLIDSTHQATVEEIIQKIIDIEITKNNGDYEIAQLKYRQKVIAAITKK